MYVVKLRNIFFIFLGIAVVTISLNLLLNKSTKVETMASSYSDVIVVDAGHGLPDGGASNGDLYESDLNLKIAKKLEEELTNRGYDVIMTRENENNIADADKQSSLSSMKTSDLNNRVKIINESGADFCISIHLNKFENPKYWGWQTFYNEKSEEGKELARCIQENITEVIKKENTRTALKIDGIKIVDKTNIPVVIVECGFISNAEEAELLQNDTYQSKLVEGICNGVEEFYH
ncbi:MAG: N-acetylmuramoyl-L-alanine amidase [Clostridia bacterium]|nr:N-acetylmuramoyl-L-alanine amidase [Clostridia bacterium]